MKQRDPVAEIIKDNRRFVDGYPILREKMIAKLSDTPFTFFRATFHLFARDLAHDVLESWQNENPFTAAESQRIGDQGSRVLPRRASCGKFADRGLLVVQKACLAGVLWGRSG